MFNRKQQKVDKKICPYESNHIIEPRKFPSHLINCKSINRHLFTYCQYNKFHVIKKSQKQAHQKTCQSKLLELVNPQENCQEVEVVVIRQEAGNLNQISQIAPEENTQPVKLEEADLAQDQGQGLSECSSCMNFLNQPANVQKMKEYPKLAKLLGKYEKKKQQYKKLVQLLPEEEKKELYDSRKSKKIHK